MHYREINSSTGFKSRPSSDVSWEGCQLVQWTQPGHCARATQRKKFALTVAEHMQALHYRASGWHHEFWRYYQSTGRAHLAELLQNLIVSGSATKRCSINQAQGWAGPVIDCQEKAATTALMISMHGNCQMGEIRCEPDVVGPVSGLQQALQACMRLVWRQPALLLATVWALRGRHHSTGHVCLISAWK